VSVRLRVASLLPPSPLYSRPDRGRRRGQVNTLRHMHPGYIATGDIVRVNFANEQIRDRAVELCKDITGSLPKDFEFAVGADWHFPEPSEPEPEPPEDDEGYELQEDEDPFDEIMREHYMDDLRGDEF
jgi:hypothetical protein